MKIIITLFFLISSPIVAQELVAIDSLPVKFDIRYADTNNFTGKNLYGDQNTKFLHPIAAECLRTACILLQLLKPGWKLVVYDALRPHSAQKELWQAVRGTPRWKYVATPTGTSLHNYGLAVDVTLEDEFGRLVDMGSNYDDFAPISEPRYEKELLAADTLSVSQVANRQFLRELMKRAGWRSVLNEWWHFEVLRREHVKGKFPIID